MKLTTGPSMEECPQCQGIGAIPINCRCGISPLPDDPVQRCKTCGDYRWAGCITCDRTGEVTPLKFRRLTMTADELDAYERQVNKQHTNNISS